MLPSSGGRTQDRREAASSAPAPGAESALVVRWQPWQDFMGQAMETFPLISAHLQEEDKENSVPPPSVEALSVLRGVSERMRSAVSEATRASMLQLKKLGKGQLPIVGEAPPPLRELCELNAIGAGHELGLKVLRQCNDNASAALGAVEGKLSEFAGLRLKLLEFREELAVRRRTRQRVAQKVAKEHLLPLEALCERLRELQRRRRTLVRTMNMRTCRALDPHGHGVAVLVFRGGHRLRLGGAGEAPHASPSAAIGDSAAPGPARSKVAAGGVEAGTLVWARFEPMLPPLEAGGESLRKFNDLMCCLWLGALERDGARKLRGQQQQQQGAVAVLAAAEVPGVVRRLDLSLLDVAEMVVDVGRSRGVEPRGAKRSFVP